MEIAEAVSLEDWVDAETWRETKAQTVFPTRDSWKWFKSRNRRTLVEDGVLVLGSGRLRDSVNSARIGSVIQMIRRQDSLDRINGATPNRQLQRQAA